MIRHSCATMNSVHLLLALGRPAADLARAVACSAVTMYFEKAKDGVLGLRMHPGLSMCPRWPSVAVTRVGTTTFRHTLLVASGLLSPILAILLWLRNSIYI